MDIQPIFDLAHLCHLKGIRNAIISPGSRNAALTVAFSRHPSIQCYSIPDERSAAFVALGMSLKTKLPTVLICTSGSAALNYAPAVAEAFFNQVPLLILTADRPPEWINQKDGQTVFQQSIYGNHVQKSYQFPSLDTHAESDWFRQRIINEAINLCLSDSPGPVHLNIPFREPFYPDSDKSYSFSNSLKVIDKKIGSCYELNEDILNQFSENSKILIVVGQGTHSSELTSILGELSTNHHIPVIGDIISNQHNVENIIVHQDVFLKQDNLRHLKPNLLITIRLSVISKNLKTFIRNNKPKNHWHIGNETGVADTYKSLSKVIKSSPLNFLNQINSLEFDSCPEYYSEWQKENNSSKENIESSSKESFNEMSCYQLILKNIPSSTDLHLANSMAVRYVNVVGLKNAKDVEVYCNRGTSGIDGTNSTAIGTAMMSEKATLLITGDMAFLYDRNAFWHNHVPDNFKVIVFNNHGGGIFRMIEGSSRQNELEEYFETDQKSDASYLAQEFGFNYKTIRSYKELKGCLIDFFNSKEKKILEIFSDADTNTKAFKELFKS